MKSYILGNNFKLVRYFIDYNAYLYIWKFGLFQILFNHLVFYDIPAKHFRSRRLSILTILIMELNDCNKSNQILNEDMPKNQITLHEKHLTDKNYENFPEELKKNFEVKLEQENFINENELQNAAFNNEIEDLQVNISQSAQIHNETTPNASDDEYCLKIPSSPTKKKKRISNRAILLPKQLKYSVKEIKNTSTTENFLPETDHKNSKKLKCKIEIFSI